MYQRILVPLDGSATADLVLQEALLLAAPLHACLVLLHVVDDYPLRIDMSGLVAYDSTHARLLSIGEGVLGRAAARAAEHGIPTESSLREATGGRVADVILDEASRQRCDLVCMGTHGRRGLDRWVLGSDAERVARRCSVPVLLVRQPVVAG